MLVTTEQLDDKWGTKGFLCLVLNLLRLCDRRVLADLDSIGRLSRLFISSGLNLAVGLMFDKEMFLWFTSRTEAEVAPCGFNKASTDLEQERDFKAGCLG